MLLAACLKKDVNLVLLLAVSWSCSFITLNWITFDPEKEWASDLRGLDGRLSGSTQGPWNSSCHGALRLNVEFCFIRLSRAWFTIFEKQLLIFSFGLCYRDSCTGDYSPPEVQQNKRRKMSVRQRLPKSAVTPKTLVRDHSQDVPSFCKSTPRSPTFFLFGPCMNCF